MNPVQNFHLAVITAMWKFFFIDISKAISPNGASIGSPDRKSYMSFRLVPKSVTFNGEMALFCVILTNLVVIW